MEEAWNDVCYLIIFRTPVSIMATLAPVSTPMMTLRGRAVGVAANRLTTRTLQCWMITITHLLSDTEKVLEIVLFLFGLGFSVFVYVFVMHGSRVRWLQALVLHILYDGSGAKPVDERTLLVLHTYAPNGSWWGGGGLLYINLLCVQYWTLHTRTRQLLILT